MDTDSRKELCKIALIIAELGVASPEYVALRLHIPLTRAHSALALMESFGWIERLELSSSTCPCSRCPLRRVCPLARGKRAGKNVHVYRIKSEVVNYCKRLLSDSRDK